eukprot:SAG25_NODE_8249_length_431_cov_1.385542_1_plen_48_part_10
MLVDSTGTSGFSPTKGSHHPFADYHVVMYLPPPASGDDRLLRLLRESS